jgi:hypothetical protein
MKDYWAYPVLKQWKKDIYARCLTHDDYQGKALAEFYDTVLRITNEGMSTTYDVQPDDLKKIVRMQKDNKRYLMPIIYEEQIPVIVIESMECQLKPSDKTIYNYVLKVKSMNIPAEQGDQTFKEFVDSFNPVEHTSPKDWAFIKLLSIASKYKSVKCCICSPPSTGKNANFMVMHHILDKCPRLSGPTPARLYQAITNNEVVVIDELTSVKGDLVREIEGMVLQLGDNSTEYIKHSQTIGRQLKEADLIKKSIIFTYNRTEDIGKKSTFFDDKWNNPAAFKSRFPQFLLDGKVIGDAPTYSYAEINDMVEEYGEQIKGVAKALSYWTQNLNKHLHKWNKDKLHLKGRHRTNLSGLIDAIDCYSETQVEFDAWCEFIQRSMDNYKKMVKGESVKWEKEQRIKVEEVDMSKLNAYEEEII